MDTDLHQYRLSHLTDQIGGEAQYPGSHSHGNLGKHEQHILTQSTGSLCQSKGVIYKHGQWGGWLKIKFQMWTIIPYPLPIKEKK